MSGDTEETLVWHVTYGGKKFGPISMDQLVTEVRDGDIHEDDLVWREGMDEWTPLAGVDEILDALRAKGVPPPIPAADPGEGPTDETEPPKAKGSFGDTAGKLGLISLILWPLAPLALPVSLVALIHGLTHPEAPGRGMAITGVVSSALGLLISVAVVAVYG
jgi:type IV pilus assembly protein PilA